MKYLKLFEQFDEEESWWDEESPFDNFKNPMKIVKLGTSYYIAEIIDGLNVELYNDDKHIYPKTTFDMNPYYGDKTKIYIFNKIEGYFIDFKDLPKEIKDRIIK